MGVFKKKLNPDKIDTIIGNKTLFEGKLSVSGGIRIDGMVKGNIECQGLLVLGNGGNVEGHIVAGSVIVGGEVVGNIRAKNRLEIISKGKVRGDVATSHLIVDDGVFLEGFCHMLNDGANIIPLENKERARSEGSPKEDEGK